MFYSQMTDNRCSIKMMKYLQCVSASTSVFYGPVFDTLAGAVQVLGLKFDSWLMVVAQCLCTLF